MFACMMKTINVALDEVKPDVTWWGSAGIVGLDFSREILVHRILDGPMQSSAVSNSVEDVGGGAVLVAGGPGSGFWYHPAEAKKGGNEGPHGSEKLVPPDFGTSLKKLTETVVPGSSKLNLVR